MELDDTTTELTCVTMRNDGRHTAVGDSRGNLRILETREGIVVKIISCHEGALTSLCFNPQGSILATGGNDGVIKLFSGDSFDCSYSFVAHSAPIRRLLFSFNGYHLTSVCSSGKVSVSDVVEQYPENSEKEKAEVKLEGTHARECGAVDVAVDATNQFFACACGGGKLEICSMLYGNAIRSYDMEFGCRSICFDPAKLYLAVLSSDHATIRLVDFYSGDCLGKGKELQLHTPNAINLS